MATKHPDYRPHRRYTVTLRSGNGSVKTVRVLTNRGKAKAAYLAAVASSGLVRRWFALEVEVSDDGPPSWILRGRRFSGDTRLIAMSGSDATAAAIRGRP